MARTMFLHRILKPKKFCLKRGVGRSASFTPFVDLALPRWPKNESARWLFQKFLQCKHGATKPYWQGSWKFILLYSYPLVHHLPPPFDSMSRHLARKSASGAKFDTRKASHAQPLPHESRSAVAQLYVYICVYIMADVLDRGPRRRLLSRRVGIGLV